MGLCTELDGWRWDETKLTFFDGCQGRSGIPILSTIFIKV